MHKKLPLTLIFSTFKACGTFVVHCMPRSSNQQILWDTNSHKTAHTQHIPQTSIRYIRPDDLWIHQNLQEESEPVTIKCCWFMSCNLCGCDSCWCDRQLLSPALTDRPVKSNWVRVCQSDVPTTSSHRFDPSWPGWNRWSSLTVSPDD